VVAEFGKPVLLLAGDYDVGLRRGHRRSVGADRQAAITLSLADIRSS
jgi:hypothetical protein